MSAPHQQTIAAIKAQGSLSHVGKTSEPQQSLLTSAGKRANIAPLRDPRDAKNRKRTSNEDIAVLAQQGLYQQAAETIKQDSAGSGNNNSRVGSAAAAASSSSQQQQQRPDSAATTSSENRNNSQLQGLTKLNIPSSGLSLNQDPISVLFPNAVSGKKSNTNSNQHQQLLGEHQEKGVFVSENEGDDEDERHQVVISSARPALMKKHRKARAGSGGVPTGMPGTSNSTSSLLGVGGGKNNHNNDNRPIVEALYTSNKEIEKHFLVKERVKKRQEKLGIHASEQSGFRSAPRPEAGAEFQQKNPPPPVGSYHPTLKAVEHKVPGFLFESPGRFRKNHHNSSRNRHHEEEEEEGHHHNNNHQHGDDQHRDSLSLSGSAVSASATGNFASSNFASATYRFAAANKDNSNNNNNNPGSPTSNLDVSASFGGASVVAHSSSLRAFRGNVDARDLKNKIQEGQNPNRDLEEQQQQMEAQQNLVREHSKDLTPSYQTFSAQGTSSFVSRAPRFAPESKDKLGYPSTPWPLLSAGAEGAVRPTGGGSLGAPLGYTIVPFDLPHPQHHHGSGNNQDESSASSSLGRQTPLPLAPKYSNNTPQVTTGGEQEEETRGGGGGAARRSSSASPYVSSSSSGGSAARRFEQNNALRDLVKRNKNKAMTSIEIATAMRSLTPQPDGVATGGKTRSPSNNNNSDSQEQEQEISRISQHSHHHQHHHNEEYETGRGKTPEPSRSSSRGLSNSQQQQVQGQQSQQLSTTGGVGASGQQQYVYSRLEAKPVKLISQTRKTFLDGLRSPAYNERPTADDKLVRKNESCGLSFERAPGRYGHTASTHASLRFQPIRKIGRVSDTDGVAAAGSNAATGGQTSLTGKEKFLESGSVNRLSTKPETDVLSNRARLRSPLAFDKQNLRETPREAQQRVNPSSALGSQVPLNHPFNSFTHARVPGLVALSPESKKGKNYSKKGLDIFSSGGSNLKQNNSKSEQQEDEVDRTHDQLSYQRTRSALILPVQHFHPDVGSSSSSSHNNHNAANASSSHSPSRFQFNSPSSGVGVGAGGRVASPASSSYHHSPSTRSQVVPESHQGVVGEVVRTASAQKDNTSLHSRSPKAFIPSTGHNSFVVHRSDRFGGAGDKVRANSPVIELDRLLKSEKVVQARPKVGVDISKGLSREDRDKRWKQ